MTPVAELPLAVGALVAFVVLVGAHYVADFAMQNDFVAKAKADTKDPHHEHALVAHCMHHAVTSGLAMLLVEASYPTAFWAAVCTAGTHYIIDHGKAVKKLYGIHVDQTLHLASALLIAFMVAGGVI